MVADKPYFEAKVKDDLSRFFQNEEVLPTLLLKSPRRWDHNCAERQSYIVRGFGTVRVFQRYPNILEMLGTSCQQLNKNVKFKICRIY